jgi:hypothetical protein
MHVPRASVRRGHASAHGSARRSHLRKAFITRLDDGVLRGSGGISSASLGACGAQSTQLMTNYYTTCAVRGPSAGRRGLQPGSQSASQEPLAVRRTTSEPGGRLTGWLALVLPLWLTVLFESQR